MCKQTGSKNFAKTVHTRAHTFTHLHMWKKRDGLKLERGQCARDLVMQCQETNLWRLEVGRQERGQAIGRLRLKRDGTCAETRFRLSAKRTSPFKSASGRQFSRLLAAEVCASAVVMLETSFSEVVWRVLATHSIRQFPLHFPSSASLCGVTFQLDTTCTGDRDSSKYTNLL